MCSGFCRVSRDHLVDILQGQQSLQRSVNRVGWVTAIVTCRGSYQENQYRSEHE